jgi:hypothetical protein
VARFCTRCGTQVEESDRFCGQCGAPVPGVAADPDEPTMAAGQGGDFFADWDDDLARGLPAVAADEPTLVPSARPDQATTESIPTVRDTAVLPQIRGPAQPAQPPPARPGPPPGPARIAPPRARGRRFPLGATIALLGALAVLMSALLPWTTGRVLEPAVFPRHLEFGNLLLGFLSERPGPNLDLVLVIAGTVGATVALITMVVPILKPLRRVVGLATLAIPVLFVLRSFPLLVNVGGGSLDGLLDFLDVGFYVAAAGAITQIVSGRWFRR